MNRTTIVALAVVAVALLLASGVVVAKNITCTGGLCTGTKKADRLIGTEGDDEINGRGGGDVIIGDPVDGEGDDTLNGGGGNDLLSDPFDGIDVDTMFGGKGNDVINVRERLSGVGGADVIDCGPGEDTVVVDVNAGNSSDQIAANCEIINPN
jgi:Ca2+-binding RTX toxin-like protein